MKNVQQLLGYFSWNPDGTSIGQGPEDLATCKLKG
jgi:hypothetical protein